MFVSPYALAPDGPVKELTLERGLVTFQLVHGLVIRVPGQGVQDVGMPAAVVRSRHHQEDENRRCGGSPLGEAGFKHFGHSSLTEVPCSQNTSGRPVIREALSIRGKKRDRLLSLCCHTLCFFGTLLMTRYNISFCWSLKERLFFQDYEENVVNSEFLHIHESKSLFRDQYFEFLHTSPLTSAAFIH